MEASEKSFVRKEVIAQFAGVTVKRIEQLTAEGIIKSEKRPGEMGRMYDFLPAIHALLAYYREKANTKAEKSPPKEALNEAKAEEAALKNRLLQAKVDIAEGNAHSTEDVRRVWNDVMGTFKMQMMNLPHRAAENFVGIDERAEAFERLSEEMQLLSAILREYSEDDFFARHTEYDDTDIDGEQEGGEVTEDDEGEVETTD